MNDFEDAKFYFNLSKICLENGKQFLEDAELLEKNKSYGHAYSLAILGFEEITKSILILNVFNGSIDKDDNIIEETFKYHVVKHKKGMELLNQMLLYKVMFSGDIFSQTLKFMDKIVQKNIKEEDKKKISSSKDPMEILNIMKEIFKNNVTIDDFEKQTDDLIDKDDNNKIFLDFINFKEKINLFSKNTKSIDKKKQLGFYVGYERNKIFSPFDITKKEANDAISFYRDLLEIWEKEIKIIEETGITIIEDKYKHYKQLISNHFKQKKEFYEAMEEKLKNEQNSQ